MHSGPMLHGSGFDMPLSTAEQPRHNLWFCSCTRLKMDVFLPTAFSRKVTINMLQNKNFTVLDANTSASSAKAFSSFCWPWKHLRHVSFRLYLRAAVQRGAQSCCPQRPVHVHLQDSHKVLPSVQGSVHVAFRCTPQEPLHRHTAIMQQLSSGGLRRTRLKQQC